MGQIIWCMFFRNGGVGEGEVEMAEEKSTGSSASIFSAGKTKINKVFISVHMRNGCSSLSSECHCS